MKKFISGIVAMLIMAFGVIQCIYVTPSATMGEAVAEEIVVETEPVETEFEPQIADETVLGADVVVVSTQMSNNATTPSADHNNTGSSQKVTPRSYARNDNDIAYIANILASECYISERGDMINVGMTICNRVDSDKFPNSVYGVVTQQGQMAYNPNRYVAPEYYDAATEVYNTWMDRQNGEDVNWNDNYLFWGAGGGTTNVFRHDY